MAIIFLTLSCPLFQKSHISAPGDEAPLTASARSNEELRLVFFSTNKQAVFPRDAGKHALG